MKFALILAIAGCSLVADAATDDDVVMPSYVSLENSGKMTLLVGYADDAAHDML